MNEDEQFIPNNDEERNMWYSALVAMPSDDFMKIANAYLGYVRTPYNRQHLIERLESFLRQEEVQKAVVSLLDDVDIMILTAVSLLAHPTEGMICGMLGKLLKDKNIVMASQLKNMQDRLLLYRDEQILRISPPLKEVLLSVTDVHTVIPLEESEPHPNYTNDDTEKTITALIAFAMQHKKVCKQDGTFAASAAKDAASQFQCAVPVLNELFNGMVNLSLVTEHDDGVTFNWKSLEKFASFRLSWKKALLCAALVVPSHDGEIIRAIAQMLLDCAATVGEATISEVALASLSTLLVDNCTRQKPNRYNQLLRSAMNTNGELARHKSLVYGQREDYSASYKNFYWECRDLFDNAIKAARKLGYVTEAQDGGHRFNFSVATDDAAVDKQTMVSIDASFTVTVMPEMPLSNMLRIVQCMELVSCQTASEYVITKESAIRAFDAGKTVEDVLTVLDEFTHGAVPPSLKVSLEDWLETYKSAFLYRGYVLRLSEAAARRFEQSAEYSTSVYEKLGAGVYLLQTTALPWSANDSEAKRVASKAGYKYIVRVHGTQDAASEDEIPRVRHRHNTVSELHNGRNIIAENEARSSANGHNVPGANRQELLKRMQTKLQSMIGLSTKKSLTLESLIKQRMILIEEQMCGNNTIRR